MGDLPSLLSERDCPCISFFLRHSGREGDIGRLINDVMNRPVSAGLCGAAICERRQWLRVGLWLRTLHEMQYCVVAVAESKGQYISLVVNCFGVHYLLLSVVVVQTKNEFVR